jgi:3-oxoacyl-[acyl-carrier protein] reductase
MMKCALVTGGSGDIGKAICRKLAGSGLHVIIHYLSNAASAEETLTTIKSTGGSGEICAFDVSDKGQVRKFYQSWKEKNPDRCIEVLVNNAGSNADNLMVFMEDRQWESVIDTNLNSFFYLTKALLTDMIMNKGGRIINIVSLSGQKGLPGQSNYAAAKAGVIGATKALAQEVGKKNITVNAVSPGYIRTEMTKDLNESELKKLIPLNRFGTSAEVADVVDFLASEKASYITGAVIPVNGGLYT